MRILHTADWHVGKKLGRFDRLPEAEAAIDEVVSIAKASEVDVVIVAGDLFDRALPPFDVMGLVLEGLQRLADTGAAVVAVAGNHDSQELFRVLGPYLVPARIHLAHKPLRPDAGGVLTIPARDHKTSAQIACFPFLHESQVVDFMEESEEWHKSYADRVRAVCGAYGDYMARGSTNQSIELLVGHFMVDGAIPSGSERQLHIGDAFMAGRHAIPSEIKYGALGHIHLCQEAPGSAVPAWYAGSLLQLDFGEVDQDKFVLLIEATSERPAKVEKMALTSGRRLVRVSDTLDNLAARAGEFGDAILDVSVLTDGPVAGLADDVREFLPNALYVRAEYEREEVVSDREGRGLDDLYSEYYQRRRGLPPPEELMDAFADVVTQVGVDW